MKKIFRQVFENTEYRTRIFDISEKLDDDQFENLIRSGFVLDNVKTIIIKFDNMTGFSIINENYNNVGRLPICKLLESKLNNEFLKMN